MNEGISNHLNLFHIANDFTCLVCYKLLHKFRGADRDAYTFDAVHLNDIVWAIDFCKLGAQTRQSRVTVNDLQDSSRVLPRA